MFRPKIGVIGENELLYVCLFGLNNTFFHLYIYVCETTKWEKRLSRKISAKRRMKRTLILETNF